MKMVENPASILIIRMGNVPMVDATGIRILKEVNAEIKKRGGKLIISEVISEQVLEELKRTRLLFQIGKANVTPTFEKALERMHEIYHK